uniref:AAA_12 domain-containing protein n=1 Tax=Panagrellus redivivus TaxID=6233 RepID=A0A7E4VT53_PANRE
MHPNDGIFVGRPPSTVTFQSPVPYRVTQKQRSPFPCVMLVRAANRIEAPAVLAINQNVSSISSISNPMRDLHIHDEVFVHSFKSMEIYSRPPDAHCLVTTRMSPSGNLSLEPHGLVLTATLGERCTTWSELAFVVRVEDGVVFIADPNTVQETPLPPGMGKDSLTGELLRVHYALHPKNTAISAQNDYAGHEDTHAAFTPAPGNILEAEVRFATRAEPVPDCIDDDELSQYYVASVAVLEISRRDRNFHADSIGPVQFVWNTGKPYHTQVIYCVEEGISTGENVFHGSANLPFRRGSIAALKRVAPGIAAESCLTPFYVRITSAIYEAGRTLISFVVDGDALVSAWNLSSIDDLHIGFYRLDPLATFCHLRTFTTKLASDKQYIQRRLADNKHKAAILRTLLPFPLPARSQSLSRPITSTKEHIFDSTLEKGAFTCVQIAAIESVIKGDPLVLIEGGAKMGKTETAVLAIPGILNDLIVPYERSRAPKCLLVVSSHPSLRTLVNKVAATSSFGELIADGAVRTLNLFDFCSPSEVGLDGVLPVIDRLMLDDGFELNAEEKECLRKVKDIFGGRSGSKEGANGSSSGYSSGRQSEDGTTPLHSPILTPTNVLPISPVDDFERVDSSAVDSDELLTSSELTALQNALKVIICRYQPNFIIAPTDLLVCMLPVLANVITHVVIDEAGSVYAIDAIAIVTESRKLEQLVLDGDRIHFPDDCYHRLERNPKCLTSAIRCLQTQAYPVVHHILRKTFYLHAGIARTLGRVFYNDRVIEPLDHANGLNLDEGFGDPDVPFLFLEATGTDQPCFPATWNNREQGGLAVYTADRILSQNPGVKVTILCYYTGQMKTLRDYVRARKLPFEVTTVDAFHGRTTDVAIVVTTRTLDERRNPIRYQRIFRDGELFLQRLPSSVQEVDPDIYQTVFNPQRLLTAISRGERAVFVIGSSELLSEDTRWAQLINMAQVHGNFVLNPDWTEEPRDQEPRIRITRRIRVDAPVEDVDEAMDMDEEEVTYVVSKRSRPEIIY